MSHHILTVVLDTLSRLCYTASMALHLPRDYKHLLLNGGTSAVRRAALAQQERTRNRLHRIRASGGSVGKDEWEQLVEQCGNRCIVLGCGRSPVTMDQRRPRVSGR